MPNPRQRLKFSKIPHPPRRRHGTGDTVKTAKRTCIVLILVAGAALGEGASPSAVSPPPSGGAPDLDFSDDFPADPRAHPATAPGKPGGPVTRGLPTSAAVAAPGPSRSWVYWTAGLAALATGGTAWYLHWGARPAPGPVRDDQVFTDAAD